MTEISIKDIQHSMTILSEQIEEAVGVFLHETDHQVLPSIEINILDMSSMGERYYEAQVYVKAELEVSRLVQVGEL